MLLGNIRGPIKDETSHFLERGGRGDRIHPIRWDFSFLMEVFSMGRGMGRGYDTINIDIDIGIPYILSSIFQTRDKVSSIQGPMVPRTQV